jgi:hypothetical protein
VRTAVESATAEMMKAWTLVRAKHPSDHVTNAERILKEAFSRLTANPDATVSAKSLQDMYSQIR